MRPIEIESWALAVIQRVESRQPNEDARVEMKAQWIEPIKAARQLAGHANAAFGSSLLWLIGVDQEEGVVGADYMELSTWLAQLSSHFDGVSPHIIDINVPYHNKTVVALLVDTDRAPFVTKNPDFGFKSGVSIAFEVPWRVGTATRTAGRSDLIRLLVPRAALPDLELLASELWLRKHDKHRWYLKMALYITPGFGRNAVIPFHRCTAELSLAGLDVPVQLSGIRLVPLYKRASGPVGSGWEPDSLTAAHTGTEIILEGPARVEFQADAWADEVPPLLGNPSVTIAVRLLPVHTDLSLQISSTLQWLPISEQGTVAYWKLVAA